ncbi:MAG: phosphatase PAP2 family protein [Bacteroidales bacterium]|nr:phosphatase PAP2 family protein [Bacteroidales bacterium]
MHTINPATPIGVVSQMITSALKYYIFALAFVLATLCASAIEAPDSLAPSDTVWVRPKLDKKRIIASNLISLGLNTGTVQLIKHNVHKLRPDGSDYNSMPSRHAAWAWNLGTRAACQLYSYNPLWASACQLGASIISEQRIMARQHFCSDVVAGSAIGSSAAIIGQVLGGIIFPGPNASHPAHLSIPAMASPSLSAL